MTASANGPGDFGRRAALRREELGLSREEVAARAGVAPGYLRYLEERSGTPDTGSLLRLAGALETTAAALRGGGVDQPTGRGQAAPRARLEELSDAECWSRLSSHGVGRIAVCEAAGPVVLPVNYSVVDGTVVIRTAAGSTPDRAAGAPVAFEVDHVDEAFSGGWSVLIAGAARRVTDASEAERLAERARSAPWAGGARDRWLRIEPVRITGRRVRTD
ncbi:pyridoxamine 5'-phosphate oxidase family protein [Streptomyces sp. B6B3]|uniref:helix-turn-helix domain-containing protein n=1 Tax=Streptomyces sp. B6B3 TaxID=3153570 RepID=UPI00325F670B